MIVFIVSKTGLNWPNTSVCTDPGLYSMDLTGTNCFDCYHYLLPTQATPEHIAEHTFLADTNFQSVSRTKRNIMNQLTNIFCHLMCG